MTSSFAPQVEGLPAFDAPYDAHRLDAAGYDVLFARYPEDAAIDDDDHETDNVGSSLRAN